MSIFTNPAARSVEEAKAYTAAILELLGTAKPEAVLTQTPDALRKSIQGLSPEQIASPEAPGKWAMRHVLRHLADSDLVWGYRVRMVLAHDRPVITGYDQDLWASRLRYDEADPEQSLQEFSMLRRANLRLITRASADDLKRIGVHAERGEESVELMVRLYAGHDILHLRQLDRIRRAVTGTSAD